MRHSLGLATELERSLHGRQQGLRGVLVELEAGAFAGADIVGFDGVVEAAGGADDGDGAVLERVDLVEAAGFVARGHEEHVGAGLDAVRHLIVVSDLDGEAAGILADETAEEILVILVSGAEDDRR